jgi:hypothetical protein
VAGSYVFSAEDPIAPSRLKKINYTIAFLNKIKSPDNSGLFFLLFTTQTEKNNMNLMLSMIDHVFLTIRIILKFAFKNVRRFKKCSTAKNSTLLCNILK